MSGTVASTSSSARTTTGATTTSTSTSSSYKTRKGRDTVLRRGASSNNSFFTNAIDFLTSMSTSSTKKDLRRTTNAAVVKVDGSRVPTWEDLKQIASELKEKHDIPECIDLESGPTSPQCLKRTFGKTGEEIRVHFYRDHAGWCPYCETVWLLLEEKRIPYTVEKINMRCYGDKPQSFLKNVPSGMLPVVVIDGVLMTESSVIQEALETKFSDAASYPTMMPPNESKEAQILFRLERKLFSNWMQWLTGNWNDKASRETFCETLDEVDLMLSKTTDSPYFLNSGFSLVDIKFAPFLERMAASLLYYKGLRIEGSKRWLHLDNWFANMSNRPTFRMIRSDYFTHVHDLPPQLGGCVENNSREQIEAMTAINGRDGMSWQLPLPPLNESSLEPLWEQENPEKDRLEAALQLVGNFENVTRFACRGASTTPARKRVSAPLSDPYATPNEDYVEAVDVALRCVAAMLLRTDNSDIPKGYENVLGASASQETKDNVSLSLEYLRDRVGVPRDMRMPAARQLRSHLNFAMSIL